MARGAWRAAVHGTTKVWTVTEHVIKMNSELRFEAYLWIAFIYFYISIFF